MPPTHGMLHATSRKDFYVPENIIGYTGSLQSSPTVYFLSCPWKGFGTYFNCEFGHITQVYPENPHNVGRERVCRAAAYTIQNERGVLHEYACVKIGPGDFLHKSRSPFIEVDDNSRDVLKKAIRRFPSLKRHRCFCPGEPRH